MHNKEDHVHYNQISSLYLQHVENPESWNNVYERPSLTALLPEDLTNLDVLDVGCGAGYYSVYALKKGARVTAVDKSTVMLEHTRQICDTEELVTIQVDLDEGLPMLADASQDVIIASLVLHYLEDWQPVLKEFHRVLRPDGVTVISTHHPLGDYLALPKNGYFDSKLLTDYWGKKGHEFPVTFFTRTLAELLNPILSSELKLISIHEPQADENCRRLNPKAYKTLSKRPGFLFLTLGK